MQINLVSISCGVISFIILETHSDARPMSLLRQETDRITALVERFYTELETEKKKNTNFEKEYKNGVEYIQAMADNMQDDMDDMFSVERTTSSQPSAICE